MNERLISQLAHVELLSPRPQESLDFMVDVLGLEESGREEQSVYLRCWGDHFHHSIVLTEGEAPGLGHAAWRAEGPEQLQMAVEQLESARVAGEWRDSVVGHGPAYRFRGPGGHPHELLWEVERYVAPPDKRSTYPARPQRPPARGIGCRQLDHLTVATSDPYADAIWYRDHLGYRFMEYTGLDEAPDVIVFAMVTTNEKSHDLGLTLDPSNIPGRIHHLALWVDTVEDVLQAADVVTEAGCKLEFGPGRHGMGEQTYLYFREPGGVRFEVNSGGYRNYQPDWPTVKWLPSQGSNTMYRNVAMPDSMMEAFPAGAPVATPEPELAGLVNPWANQHKS